MIYIFKVIYSSFIKNWTYSIVYNNHWHDYKIANILNLTLFDYHTELRRFNFKTFINYKKVTFQNEEDAQKVANYLNEKYGVILKLQGIV